MPHFSNRASPHCPNTSKPTSISYRTGKFRYLIPRNYPTKFAKHSTNAQNSQNSRFARSSPTNAYTANNTCEPEWVITSTNSRASKTPLFTFSASSVAYRPNESPLTYIQSLSERKYSNIGHIDISLELDAQNDNTNARRIAEATFAIVLLPGARLFFDPLTDFDRTMDVTHGLLGTLCNPRAPFSHPALSQHPPQQPPFTLPTLQIPPNKYAENNRVLYLNNTHRQLALVLPARDIFDLNTLDFSLDTSPVRIYHLCTGETETVSRDAQIEIQDALPFLVVGQA